ncbi:Ankyrin repeat domain-containing protein 13C [Chytridiales sp. JEL 0842]|nr:Ankyrin repeat domain-containing protein 13C [Chytridiales sp. JEL 0842]
MTKAHQLHQAIFRNDLDALKEALIISSPADSPHPEINSLCRGHTPLTLAVCLNRKEMVPILLEAGASTLIKTLDGWSPYQEATSIGDRDLMTMLYRKRRHEMALWFESKGKDLLETLSKDLKDFYLEMHWSFQSWIPFVSKLCPSDTYKIFKKGTSLRIDTTLVGFERLSWIRGDISIIFSETPDGPKLVVCDHQRRLVQQVYPMDFTISDEDISEEVSVCLNTDIIAPPEIDFQGFNLNRAQSGFWSFKVDKNEKVGPWETQVWNVDSFEIENRSRTEHLEVEPLPIKTKHERARAAKLARKKAGGLQVANADSDDESEEWASAAVETNGNDESYEEWTLAKKHFHELSAFRPTLTAPPEPTVTFEEFFDELQLDKYLHIGREPQVKSTKKTFKGTMWMYNGGPKTAEELQTLGTSTASDVGPPAIQSPAFPIQLSTLLPVLELIGMGSNQHIRSLREFFNVQLPPGFPVKVEMPLGILPLSAAITFQNISTTHDFGTDIFNIPGKKQGYRAGEVIKSQLEQ